MELYQIYHPLTATPFERDISYIEEPPCDALKPYIRCFWGSPAPYLRRAGEPLPGKLVVPDTCMDLIFTVNFTQNTVGCFFCGIDDRTFHSQGRAVQTELVSTFAVRFYAWSAALFAEDSMRGMQNARVDGAAQFGRLVRGIGERLFDVTSWDGRVALAQSCLWRCFYEKRVNCTINDVMAAMLPGRGTLSVAELSRSVHISVRQIERAFSEYIGISPKRLSSLVRYQYLWQEMLLTPQFDVQDAVLRYGYADQAHLLREFKRFHGMLPGEAYRYAMARRSHEECKRI